MAETNLTENILILTDTNNNIVKYDISTNQIL